MTVDIESLHSYQASHYQDPDRIVDVIPAKEGTLDDVDLHQLVKVCNQPLIFDVIFKERVESDHYPFSKAEEFRSWAAEGWQKGTYFVYVVRCQGKVVGNIDIKSNKTDGAEVGYLMSSKVPGYMTNVLLGLLKQAKSAGFERLVSYTKPMNDKSQRLLKRAGFEHQGQKEIDGKMYEGFEIILQ